MTDTVDRPVVYIPISAYNKARDDKSAPHATLKAQTGWSNQVASRSSIKANSSRLRCVVLSTLHDCPVEGVSVYPNHSYQTGQPIVPDANGKPQRPPSAANALAGSTSVDWIDAPPKNFASVGIWATNRPSFSLYGTDIGLQVQMPALNSVLQLSLIENISNSSHKYLGVLSSINDARKSDKDFYDQCDDNPIGDTSFSAPDSAPLTNPKVKVSLRTGGSDYGVDLYAFIEAAS